VVSLRRILLGAVVAALLPGCSSSDSGSAATPHGSDASIDAPEVGDATFGISDAPAAPCTVTPYPNGLACSDPNQACVPEGGWDCCRCLTTTNCKYPTQWACESADPGCPAAPPAVGTTCALRQYATCIYCDQAAIVVVCNSGTWQPVENHFYCQASD
jgi:hypothetical protein